MVATLRVGEDGQGERSRGHRKHRRERVRTAAHQGAAERALSAGHRRQRPAGREQHRHESRAAAFHGFASPKPVAAKPDPQLTEKEKARIRKMKCSDFVWEWELIRDEADDAAATEFMPRIATAMYAAARTEAGEYVDAKVWKASREGAQGVRRSLRRQLRRRRSGRASSSRSWTKPCRSSLEPLSPMNH